MIDSDFIELSLRAQFQLLSLNRSSFYYHKIAPDQLDQDIANQINELWLKYSFYGYRKITAVLRREGTLINRKKVQRLMQKMNLAAIFPKAHTNKWVKEKYNQYPYLLKDLIIFKTNQVWATDTTYIRLDDGFVYFLAIIDLHSRFILSSYLSTSLEADFCVGALESALQQYKNPEIFNTDQGSQFTSAAWYDLLTQKQFKISMDGKGRCFDNIFTERLWRTVKYEEVYLKSYKSVVEARQKLTEFVDFYNNERPHQALNYKTPSEVYIYQQQELKLFLKNNFKIW